MSGPAKGMPGVRTQSRLAGVWGAHGRSGHRGKSHSLSPIIWRRPCLVVLLHFHSSQLPRPAVSVSRVSPECAHHVLYTLHTATLIQVPAVSYQGSLTEGPLTKAPRSVSCTATRISLTLDDPDDVAS